MQLKTGYFQLMILSIIVLLGQSLCSCSKEDDEGQIGGSGPYYSVIVDVCNSKGESLLNPATEDNYVGKPIKVVVKKWDTIYEPCPVYEVTFTADWSEAFWNKDMWRLYNTLKDDYPEQRYVLKDTFHILSKDKKINSHTDKLLCIGLFEDDLYSDNFRIEWPDGKIDYIRQDKASTAEKSVYWYVNNRRVQEVTLSSVDTPLRIVHN